MKEIELSKGLKALVDDEDYERVNQYKWSASKGYRTYYASRIHDKKNQLLHRYIMNENNSKIKIDHIDHNGLNNQKLNLRKCTNSQNMMNQIKTRGKSKYKGVLKVPYLSKKNPWKAQIMKNYVCYHIGMFRTEEDAAQAYNKKEIELFGKFAKLNICQLIKQCEER